MSTKLWVEDRTQYTKTDRENEEEITLGGGGTNREEGSEKRSRREFRTNSEKRLKGDDQVIRQMEGVNTEERDRL